MEATTPNANPLKCGDTIQGGNLRDFLIHFDKSFKSVDHNRLCECADSFTAYIAVENASFIFQLKYL